LGDLPSWEHIISSYPTFGKRKNHLRGWSVGLWDMILWVYQVLPIGLFVCYNSPYQENGTRKTIIDLLEVSLFEVSVVSMDQISPQDQDRSTYTSVFP